MNTPRLVVLSAQIGTTAVISAGVPGRPGANGADGRDSEEFAVYAKRVDFVSDNLLYRGEAAVGSADSEAVWRIRKVVIAGDGDITETWAGGSALFDKVWDDRASLGYS